MNGVGARSGGGACPPALIVEFGILNHVFGFQMAQTLLFIIFTLRILSSTKFQAPKFICSS